MAARGRRTLFWDDIWPVIAASFDSGFTIAHRPDLVNHVGDTRFVGAGLQIFEHALYGGADVPSGRLFVPQPAIRLNYLDAVAHSDGFSTAFLNVCTEQASAGVEDFLAHLDAWLVCFTTLGVASTEITLVWPAASWFGGPFRGSSLVTMVSGVEVGDLVFIDDGAPEVWPLLPIVDTSFGLERLVAALNTGVGYSSLLGPLPQSAVPQLRVPLDRLRTATLMVMAGLTPVGRGRGRVLRSLATTDVPGGVSLDIDAVVAHAHAYWSVFHTPVLERERCQALVRTERERSTNRRLLDAVGRPSAARGLAAAPTSEVCRRLLRSGVPENALTAGVTGAGPVKATPRPARRRDEPDPRSALTILTPTSPIPSNPSTALLERAVRSLVRHAGMAGCRQLIVCDGTPYELGQLEPAYEEYKRRLRKIVASGELGTRAEIIELDRCVGLGGVMLAAVASVDTPYLLTYEHDWRLTRPLDTSAVLRVLADDRDVHYVRLNKRRTYEAGWDSVLNQTTANGHSRWSERAAGQPIRISPAPRTTVASCCRT